MDLSTDSQVEFELYVGASDGDMADHEDGSPAEQAAVNVVAIGVNCGPTPSTATTSATAETTSVPPTTGGYPSAPGSVGSHLPTTGVHPPAIDSVGGGSSTAGG